MFCTGATAESKAEVKVVERTNQVNASKTETQTRTSPTNPMSVSVPNLPASMEQSGMSLLETFAAVARRNAGNNMLRSNNAISLARLLPPNSPSDWTGLCSKLHFIHLHVIVIPH